MKRRTRHALLAMFDSPLNVELRNVDIASFYPTERYIQKLVLGIEPVQSGTGDPSPDNVRPISGFTGLNVYGTGANLLDPDELDTSVNNFIWGYRGTGFLFKGGKTYTLSFGKDISSIRIVSVDEQIVLAQAPTLRYVTYTPTVDTLGVIRLWSSGITMDGLEPMLSLSSMAQPYQPYVGTTLPVSWQSEAGTVYAGYLSIDKDGNVTLTGTHVKDTFTKDSAWYSFATGTGNSSAVVQLSQYQNCYFKSGAASFNGAISSTGKESPNYWANNRQNELPPDGDMCFAYSESGALRFHRTDVANITDIASFKANFPDTEVLYKLKNPVTYTLSSVTPIATIRPGINNVWCDTGPVIELIS